MGPTVSIDHDTPATPRRLTSPQVGRRPVSPLHAAGIRVDPPVSSARALAHRNAAVAAAEPLLEMPGLRDRSHGLRGWPPGWWKLSPSANSDRFSLPSSTAPASLSFDTTTASSLGTWSHSSAEPYVVRMPAVSNWSFTATGMPCKGPRYCPAAISRSAARAACRASWWQTVM